MILNLLKNRYSQLAFSLFCGLVYFGIVMHFVSSLSANGSTLLAFFFLPAIVCGVALIFFKMIHTYVEEGDKKKLSLIFWFHITLAVVSLILALSVFFA